MDRMLLLLLILLLFPSLALAQTDADTAIFVKYQPDPTFEYRSRTQIPNDTIVLLTDREFRNQNSIGKPTLLSLKDACEKLLKGKNVKFELRNLAEDATKQLSREQVLALEDRIYISTLYHLGISRFCHVKGLDEHAVSKRLSDRERVYLDQILEVERESLSTIAKVLSEDANIEMENVLQLIKIEKVIPCQLLYDDLAKLGKDGLEEMPDEILLYEFQLSYGQLIRGKAIPRNEFLETIQALGDLDSVRSDLELQRRIGEKFQDYNQKAADLSRTRLSQLETGDRREVQDALKLSTQSLKDLTKQTQNKLLEEFDEKDQHKIEKRIVGDAMGKGYPLSILFSDEALKQLRVNALPSEVRVKLKSACQEAAEKLKQRLLNLQYMILVETLLDGDIELLDEERFHFIQGDGLPVPPLDLLFHN